VDPAVNPYSTPPAFVGRNGERQSWRAALEGVESGRPVRPMVLHGLHGTGLTSLLLELRREAASRGWLVLHVEGAASSLRAAVGASAREIVKAQGRRAAGYAMVKATDSAKAFARPRASSRRLADGDASGGDRHGSLAEDLRTMLRDLASAAAEERVGLALLVDDAQELTPEDLGAVCAVARDARKEEWGLLVALAGSSDLLATLDRTAWYGQWLFRVDELLPLADEEAREALVTPARRQGVPWQGAALDLVIQEGHGYPLLLNAYAAGSWNRARGKQITEAAARAGIESGRAELDAAYFESFWSRATPSEQAYLRAIAANGEESGSGAVAARMGRTGTSLGPARASLLAKGLIYAPRRGAVAFTVAGMGEFVRRQPGD